MAFRADSVGVWLHDPVEAVIAQLDHKFAVYGFDVIAHGHSFRNGGCMRTSILSRLRMPNFLRVFQITSHANSLQKQVSSLPVAVVFARAEKLRAFLFLKADI